MREKEQELQFITEEKKAALRDLEEQLSTERSLNLDLQVTSNLHPEPVLKQVIVG